MVIRKRIAFLLIVVLMMQLIPLPSTTFATELNMELVKNGDAEAGNISEWADHLGGDRWSAGQKFSDWAPPAEGEYYFFLNNATVNNLSGTMSQTITLSDNVENDLFSKISSGNIAIQFSIYMHQKYNVGNEVKVILEQYNQGSTLLKTSSLVNTSFNGTMKKYTMNADVHPNTRKFKIILSASLTSGGYAQFDGVSLKLVDASNRSAPFFDDFPTHAEILTGQTYTTNFTISDADPGDLDLLNFNVSSTDIYLVPAANVSISGSGMNRTLTIQPVNDLYGETDITVTASDGFKSSSKTLRLIVHRDISLGTNLVINGNGTTGLDSWSGNIINIVPKGNGFLIRDPNSYMYQIIPISKFSTLINTGETNFSISADFDKNGKIEAHFCSDFACTQTFGNSYTIDSSNDNLQQKIPANAKAVKITFSNTRADYAEYYISNINFQILNDFPRIIPFSDVIIKYGTLNKVINAIYSTPSATLTAVSSDQEVVPDSNIVINGTGFDRTISITPLKAGTTTMKLTLDDGNQSVNEFFTISFIDDLVADYFVNSPADINILLTSHSAQLITDVVYGGNSLTVNNDYEVFSDTLTIKKAFLENLTLNDGDTATFDITFSSGNTLPLVITAKTYNLSTNANLSSLLVNGTLVSGFDPNITDYNVKLPLGTTKADITATTDDPSATFIITNTTIPGTATVIVTAEDKITTKTYSIHFTVETASPIGGSDNHEGSNSTPTPIEPVSSEYDAHVVTDSGSTITLKVMVDRTNGVATVDLTPLISMSGNIVITMPQIPNIQSYSFVTLAESLTNVAVESTYTIHTSIGSISIPSNMLTSITNIHGSKATFAFGKVDPSSLSDEVRDAIGDRPILTLTLSIDGEQIDWNNPDAPVFVSIPYTPTDDELRNPEGIIIWYIDGKGNIVTIPSGRYDATTGMVHFSTTHFSQFAVSYKNATYADVPLGKWFSKAISFVNARDVMTGTDSDMFNPDAKMTRAELLVLFMNAFRIAVSTEPLDNFSDAGNTYYTPYLATAKKMGISTGIGNNQFAPNREITRQEMFTLLYNTLKAIGQLPQGISEKPLDPYSDANLVADWASEAIQVLANTNIINGYNGFLHLLNTTTRAEIAEVLYKLFSK